MKKNDINKDDFERTKKMIYGDYIKEYNDVSNIARMFLGDFMKGINSFEYIEEITGLDIDYVKQVLTNNFKKEKMVYSVIKNS
jgi:predicted Zn-dependent peptidase